MKKIRLKVWIGVVSLLSVILVGCGDPTAPTEISPSLIPSKAATTNTTTQIAPTTTSTTNATSQNTTTTLAATTASSPATPNTTTAPGTNTATTAAATSGQTSEDWPTYHKDNLRTGYIADIPDPQKLSQKWNMQLDGAVYAEPLLIGSHLIVATENDSIYSLDALTGKTEWRTNLGKPVSKSSLPCGNINPLGITGTPVYDPATKLIFAVAEVTGPAHLLAGVDLDSGQVKLRRSADIPGMEPATHQQRAALALAQGMVYIAYGGLWGDCGNYHGLVLALRTDGQGNLAVFQVPTPREGGIWGASGPAIDANGKVYVAVGNGEQTEGNWDHSDSVLRLSADLKLEDGFAPKEWQQDNERDADLGSIGPVLLPNGYIFISGKSGKSYTLKANALGGVGGQVQVAAICDAYGGAATVGNQVFAPCSRGLLQVTVGNDGKITRGWQVDEAVGSPVVGGHTVYSLDHSGKLYAFNLETGEVRTSLALSQTSRFATPTLGKGLIFVPTLTGVVAVAIN